MVEIVPYLLVIIGFHPDLPSPRLMELTQFDS